MKEIKSDFFNNQIATYNNDELVCNKNNKILVDFYANWCNPCRVMKKILENVESEYQDVDFYSIDIDDDENKDLVSKMEIVGLPVLLMINTEGEYKKLAGNRTAEKIKNNIDKYILMG